MSDPLRPWSVQKSTVLLERPWLKLREDRVTLPGHIETFDFNVVEMPEWVGILAVTEHEQLLFVEQYRHGCGRVSRELPAGVIDPGEEPLAAAQRELLEETGHAAQDWRPLIALLPEPNRFSTRAHFYFARGARRVGEQQPDATEQIHVVHVDTGAVWTEIASGRVEHGVHIAAILFAMGLGLLPRAY
jgi:8-oxo-dGTP pyrophosphatase MutT (NUDIX family)